MHLTTGISNLKSIAFFCCTNGYGHYKRVLEIASYLASTHDVYIYCNKQQADKIGTNPGITYIYYTLDNINWSKVLHHQESEMIEEYFRWMRKYGPEVTKYDIVISDNLIGLLEYRTDILIQGSFFWKDVLDTKIGTNLISSNENDLLEAHSPTLVTNKYVETQSVKTYSNKLQFGFGFESRRTLHGKVNINLINSSSLKYLPSYSKFIERAITENSLVFVDNFSYIDNVRMFARPGVGTITHCLENSIPLIALYDDSDSQEIIQLAQVVEDLQLGFKQDVNKPLDIIKLTELNTNTEVVNSKKVEIGAYRKIAKYINSILN